jgi:hypothetical protein
MFSLSSSLVLCSDRLTWQCSGSNCNRRYVLCLAADTFVLNRACCGNIGKTLRFNVNLEGISVRFLAAAKNSPLSLLFDVHKRDHIINIMVSRKIRFLNTECSSSYHVVFGRKKKLFCVWDNACYVMLYVCYIHYKLIDLSSCFHYVANFPFIHLWYWKDNGIKMMWWIFYGEFVLCILLHFFNLH